MGENYKRGILEAILQKYPEDVSIGNLTNLTGYARATVAKYLGHLEEEGFVAQNRKVGKTRMYSLGPKIQTLLGNSEGGEEIRDLLRITAT